MTLHLKEGDVLVLLQLFDHVVEQRVAGFVQLGAVEVEFDAFADLDAVLGGFGKRTAMVFAEVALLAELRKKLP